MLKKIIIRGVPGLILGTFIANLMSLISSTIYGNGVYYPAYTAVINQFDSQIEAVWVVFGLSALIGFLYGVTSLLFEADKLNLVVQTTLHCLINFPTVTLIAWLCYWMPHNKTGFIIWIIEYFVIYIIIWLSFYLSYKTKVKQINKALSEKQE